MVLFVFFTTQLLLSNKALAIDCDAVSAISQWTDPRIAGRHFEPV